MRTPHAPAANVNLGDDPDPAAELGQRMAATAQTSQGLLTNYLFYGQRRQFDRALPVVRQSEEDHADDHGLEIQRGAAAQRGRSSQRAQRATVYQPSEAQASDCDSGRKLQATPPPRIVLFTAEAKGAERQDRHPHALHGTDLGDDQLSRDALAAHAGIDASRGLVDHRSPTPHRL